MSIRPVKARFAQGLDSPLFQFYLNCKTGIRLVKAHCVRGLDSAVFRVCIKP